MIHAIPRTALFAATLLFGLAGLAPAQANLLTNGDFETENANPSIPPPDWSASGDGMAIDSYFAYSGAYDVAFTAPSSDSNPGTLSQTVATVAGEAYTLSFWLYDQNIPPSADEFVATFGDFTDNYSPDLTLGSYTNVTLAIPGSDVTSTSTVLSFQALLDPNYSTSPIYLDDVSLTPASAAIPEPSVATLFGVALGLIALFGAWGRHHGRR